MEINLKNTAITEITADKSTSLDAIEAAKNKAIQDIIDAASEIIGGDFLTRGGTTYNNAKEIEDDINELKSRPSGAAVILAEVDETTASNITIILNKADMSGQETISQNIQYTMIAGAGIDTTPGLLINVKVNGVVYPLKRETFNGSTIYTDVKTGDLVKYQTYIFFYNPVYAAYFVRTNFLATSSIAGLVTIDQIYKAPFDYIDINVASTRTNEDIVNDINTALTAGKKARLYNFRFAVTVPYCSMYDEGILSFEPNGSGSLLLTYLPKYDSGVTRLEAIVGTSGGLIPPTWQFYTRDNWKHYGGEE